MAGPVRIIGSYLSPYVRKVLVCLHVKGIAYEIDPIVRFFGDERFAALSPLRRVPVLIDDRVTLCDSSVICQYLDDNAAFARFAIDAARWPRAEAFVRRVLASEPFARLVPFEECMLRTPLPEARAALAAADAPLLAETYGTARPRRGVMPL